MDFKLATSRRPAQAVGYPAQSRGADGDGGGTAGTPPVGVGAIGVTNSQLCESPLLSMSQWSVGRTKGNLHPLPTAGSSPEPDSCAGAPPDGSGTMPSAESPAPPVKLKDRRFRLATWNMCGQDANRAGKLVAKTPFAEQLMLLERLDLLVLMEMHTDTLPFSRGRTVLRRMSLPEARAGVAVVAHSSGGWECTRQEVLIEGYALALHLTHRVSREAFWLLGVYADNSGGVNSLLAFYVSLRKCLSALVASLPSGSWSGCMAVGDWNFVEHLGDRSPATPSNPRLESLLEVFSDISALCAFQDAAGPGLRLRGWTYSRNVATCRVFSRLDRLYVPHDGWAAERPYVLSTSWSDHRVVVSDLIVTKPVVQVATPAPRLPNLDGLGKSKMFWPGVLAAWDDIGRNGRPTLERWTAFKGTVLREGLAANASFRKKDSKYWRNAVRKEELTPDEIWDAVRGLAQPQRSARPRGKPIWAEAVPKYSVPPAPRKSFRPSPSSPWQVPVLCSPGTLPAGSSGAPIRETPSARTVADMLDDKASALRKNALWKMKRMAEKHTSEWYNLSLNKEADERGSHTLASVAGLRRPQEDTAWTDLGHMTAVSRDYFESLHRPEPMPVERLLAQDTLIEEVVATYWHVVTYRAGHDISRLTEMVRRTGFPFGALALGSPTRNGPVTRAAGDPALPFWFRCSATCF